MEGEKRGGGMRGGEKRREEGEKKRKMGGMRKRREGEKRLLLPVSKREAGRLATVLRAPKELGDIIADLGFSARVHFFLKFLSKNIPGARRIFIFKIRSSS